MVPTKIFYKGGFYGLIMTLIFQKKGPKLTNSIRGLKLIISSTKYAESVWATAATPHHYTIESYEMGWAAQGISLSFLPWQTLVIIFIRHCNSRTLAVIILEFCKIPVFWVYVAPIGSFASVSEILVHVNFYLTWFFLCCYI